MRRWDHLHLSLLIIAEVSPAAERNSTDKHIIHKLPSVSEGYRRYGAPGAARMLPGIQSILYTNRYPVLITDPLRVPKQ